MESGPRTLVDQIAIAAVFCAATAYAQPGTAAGGMTVDGRQFALRHAYASVQPGSFDPKAEDVRVLLTDVPLAETVRTDMSALIRLARGGQLHAIEVVLDANGEPMSGQIFLEAFNGMVSVSGVHQFQPKTLDRTLVSGRMLMDGPRTFAGVTYHYDVTFSASIPRPPTAEETAAALRSPPAIAAAAHLKAIRSDFDAFVGTLTEASAAAYRLPGGVDRFKEVRAETPADSRVVSLTEGPNGTHIATVQGMRGTIILEFSLKVRREGTAWKIER